MTIALNTIRYYTQADPYHYSVDNRPLYDLEQNDIILRSYMDQIVVNTSSSVLAGTWGSIIVSFDLTVDRGRPFAYKIKTWVVEDKSLTDLQSSYLSEDIIVGYSHVSGVVNILEVSNLFIQSYGPSTLTKVFTGSGNNLNINFSGYSGSNGYVQCRAERFGI